jgi:zinc transporter ZupT
MGMLLLENLSHYITTTMKPAAKGHVSPPDANTPADTPKASQSTSSSGAVRTTATLTAAGKASPDSAAAGKGKSDAALNTPIIDCKPDTEHDADDHEHQHEHGHQHLGCGGHHHPRAAAGAAGAVDPARQAYIGLLVHSLADGLAVGAASLSTNLAVTFTVASAMVLHKGPVAFGLTLYLQSANWDARKRHQALLLFCGMSPLAAILTYGIFSQLPGVTTTMNIALCVLFSGGTFLYAACIHIFPSIVAPDGLVPNMQLPWLVVGSALPLFLSTLVPHHH